MKRKLYDTKDNKKSSILKHFSSIKETLKKESDNLNETSFKIENQEIGKESDIFPSYLVNNFDKLLSEIMNNEYDKKLFSEDEMLIINLFKSLPKSSQSVFLKIYGRQWKWHRFEKENLIKSCLHELSNKDFITNDMKDLILKDKLDLLLVEEILKINKKFNILSASKRKNEVIESIIKATNSKADISNFFISKSCTTLLEKIEKELSGYLINTYKVSFNARNAFCKITVLFSLTTCNWDECSHLGERNQKELFQLLQVDRGLLSFPIYRLSRVSNIFLNSLDLTHYTAVMECSLKLRNFIENNKFEEASEVYVTFSKQYPIDCEKSLVEEERNMPNFLKRFTLRSLIIHAYSLGVTLMEKQRKYEHAVDILKFLIKVTKTLSISKSRGKWYLRLCVNYKSHLKNQVESKFWLEQALKDKSVPKYFKLTFQNRLDKFRNENFSVKAFSDFEDSNDGFPISEKDIHIKKIRKIEASWQKDVIDSYRPRYMWREGNDIVYCHVEDYVLKYLIRNENYRNGIHGETGIFIFYFVLLFYDIIYADVPDAFYCLRQTVPLDLYSTCFRQNRKQIIDNKFDWLLHQASESDINEVLINNWRTHANEMGIVVNWTIVENEQQLLGLFSCLGLDLILKISDRFFENFNYWSSGMPDLIVWNSDTGAYEIIEVKGPGDSLSDKQKLWIMELQSMGANVSLCQVQGICHKKL